MSDGVPLCVTVVVDFGGGGPRGGGGDDVREAQGGDERGDGVEVCSGVRGGSEARVPVRESADAEFADRPPCRAARLLALAEFVERCIEAGDLRDLTDAAELRGRARPLTAVRDLRTKGESFARGEWPPQHRMTSAFFDSTICHPPSASASASPSASS